MVFYADDINCYTLDTFICCTRLICTRSGPSLPIVPKMVKLHAADYLLENG